MSQRSSNGARSVTTASGALLAIAIACQATPPAQDPRSATPDETLAVDPAPPPQQPDAQGSLEVSDAQVEAFARAYVAVVHLEQKYTSELQAAASPHEAESVQEQAQQEMQQAIEDEGMTLMEFEQIGTKASDDESLRVRVEQKLVELQQTEE